MKVLEEKKPFNALSLLSRIASIISSRESFDNIIKQLVFTLESELDLKNTHIKILNYSRKFYSGPEDERRKSIESGFKLPAEDIVDIGPGRKLLVVPIRFEGRDLGYISSMAEAVSDDIMKVLRVFGIMLGMSFFLIGREKTEIRRVGEIVYRSKKMEEVIKEALKVSESDATVLIMGESGVGKELIAELIHKNSQRKDKPLVKVNSASIPETLLESELFGYRKGAFTGATFDKKGKFELADGGTIFLDEIGDMPLHLQAKILRVLQSKEIEPVGGQPKKIDVRIIAATNRNLEELVKQEKFREDLYYRLFVIPIYVPPLRERKEDIYILVEYFIERFNTKYKKAVSISKSAMQILENYDWPGNVRELENLIERLVLTSSDLVITAESIPQHIKKVRAQLEQREEEAVVLSTSRSLETIVEDIEKKAIMDVISQTKNLSEAAKKLGITRRQLEWRIKKYKIQIQK
ncbi:MAG: sigma 54-interacting transcriptional regulator [Candidatus Calescibacterium sp.]|nr:sigma 54-interacting transcriptional regulator [Candidatus Calescibacterium sp.]